MIDCVKFDFGFGERRNVLAVPGHPVDLVLVEAARRSQKLTTLSAVCAMSLTKEKSGITPPPKKKKHGINSLLVQLRQR